MCGFPQFPSAEMVGHHAPDEAGKFSCNSSNCNTVLGMGGYPVEFSAESFIVLVSISNYLGSITCLSSSKRFGFVTNFTSGIAVCRFDQRPSQMRVSGFGCSQSG